MPDTQPAAATREELTRRCGHECLNQPDHDGPHFYGYRMGRYSYEGLLAENDRLHEAIEVVYEDAKGGALDIEDPNLAELFYVAGLTRRNACNDPSAVVDNQREEAP